MVMKQGINRVRAKNFKIASNLKKYGYNNAIDMLPQEAIDEINNLMSKKMPINEVMSGVSSKFPNLKFPSRETFRKYRYKHYPLDFVETRKKTRQFMRENASIIDDLSNRLKLSAGQQLLHLVENTIPKMVKTLDVSLDMEEKLKVPVRMNNERARAVSDLLNVSLQWMYKGGVNIFHKDILTLQPGGTIASEEGGDSENEPERRDPFHEVAEILARRGTQITIERERHLSITQ